MKTPNLVHFIHLQDHRFPEHGFNFTKYLCLVCAHKFIRPDKLTVFGNTEPQSEWWDRIREVATFEKVQPPDSFEGNRLDHPAHKADVIRLQVLEERGGIYLDTDVLPLRSFNPLRDDRLVLGKEGGKGLCNAVILSPPGHDMIRTWLGAYRGFNDAVWQFHSVFLPRVLAPLYGKAVHLVPENFFYFPSHHDPYLLFSTSSNPLVPMRRWAIATSTKWRRTTPNADPDTRSLLNPLLPRNVALKKLRQSYALHLWENVWKDYLKPVDPQFLLKSPSNFAQLLRERLGTDFLADLS